MCFTKFADSHQNFNSFLIPVPVQLPCYKKCLKVLVLICKLSKYHVFTKLFNFDQFRQKKALKQITNSLKYRIKTSAQCKVRRKIN